jgi:hypothetical protein
VGPVVWELLGADGDRVREATIRFASPRIEIPGVRTAFWPGSIATCRIRGRDVLAVRGLPDVISVKPLRVHDIPPAVAVLQRVRATPVIVSTAC